MRLPAILSGLTLCLFMTNMIKPSAQVIDSTGLSSLDRTSISPSIGLITLGLILNEGGTKTSLQSDIHSLIGTTDSHIDDYLQYLPSVGLLAYQLQFKTDKHTRGYHLRQFAISSIATQAITYSLKFATNEKRPRGGPRSFPSGHTSFAFSTATVLYHIYKEDHQLIAWSFYLPAVVTGTMRIMRDDHWAPDVLVGAGIGILTTQLTYMLVNKKKRHNVQSSKLQNLHFGMSHSGISIIYQLF